MSTTNQTYGVDADVLNAYLPQVALEGTNDVLTSTFVTTLVAGASATVNGVLIAADLSPSDIAADTDSAAYLQCQALVARLVVPHILRAIVGNSAAGLDMIDQAQTHADAHLERFRMNPPTVGADDDTNYSPQAQTTTQALDVSSADGDRKTNRKWDIDAFGAQGSSDGFEGW